MGYFPPTRIFIFEEKQPHPNSVIASLRNLTGLQLNIVDMDGRPIDFQDNEIYLDISFSVKDSLFAEDLFVNYEIVSDDRITLTSFFDDESLNTTYLFETLSYVLLDLSGKTYNKRVVTPEWAKVKWEIAKNMEGVKYLSPETEPILSWETQLHMKIDRIMWESWLPMKYDDISVDEQDNCQHWLSAGNYILRYIMQNESKEVIVRQLVVLANSFEDLPQDVKKHEITAVKLIEARNEFSEFF